MMVSLIPSALTLLFVSPLPEKAGPTGAQSSYRVTTFRQRIVIRVPRLPDAPPPPRMMATVPVPEWKERKAEKCLPISGIAGAAVNKVDSVDLMIVDGRRLRARFDDDCQAIDFYAGFYLRRTTDGMICAKRDSIRSRSGDSCRIEVFRELRPRR